MDCYSNRLTTTFSTFTVMLAFAALVNYMSSFLYPQIPKGELALGSVLDFTVHPHLKADQSNINFNVKADLTSAFQWNTHQLYVYVMAQYKTPTSTRDEVILWDTILSKKESAVFEFKGVLNDYPLRSRHRHLKNRDIKLILAYRYMPLVGLMKEYIVTESVFTMPNQYFQYRSKQHAYSVAG